MAIKARLVQFRQGRHTIHEKHYIIAVDGIEKKSDTTKVVGKNVSWKSPAGKIIKGKIAAPHGTKGRVRAIFEKGLPGQSITTEVEQSCICDIPSKFQYPIIPSPRAWPGLAIT